MLNSVFLSFKPFLKCVFKDRVSQPDSHWLISYEYGKPFIAKRQLHHPCSHETLMPLGSCAFSGWPRDKQRHNGAAMRHLCILHSSLRPAELMGGLADCTADDEWFYTCRENITSHLQCQKNPQTHTCCCGTGLCSAHNIKAIKKPKPSGPHWK